MADGILNFLIKGLFKVDGGRTLSGFEGVTNRDTTLGVVGTSGGSHQSLMDPYYASNIRILSTGLLIGVQPTEHDALFTLLFSCILPLLALS